MPQTISDYLTRTFTLYFFLITFLSGAICYFILQKTLKAQYPTEAKIAKWGGLIYMFGGFIVFAAVKLFL